MTWRWDFWRVRLLWQYDGEDLVRSWGMYLRVLPGVRRRRPPTVELRVNVGLRTFWAQLEFVDGTC